MLGFVPSKFARQFKYLCLGSTSKKKKKGEVPNESADSSINQIKNYNSSGLFLYKD